MVLVGVWVGVGWGGVQLPARKPSTHQALPDPATPPLPTPTQVPSTVASTLRPLLLAPPPPSSPLYPLHPLPPGP